MKCQIFYKNVLEFSLKMLYVLYRMDTKSQKHTDDLVQFLESLITKPSVE